MENNYLDLSVQTSGPNSNINSPSNNSFSSEYDDALEVTNFNLNDFEKINDLKSNIENKNFLIPVKKISSGYGTKDKKSLFFTQKDTEIGQLLNKIDFEIISKRDEVLYEGI